MTDYVEYELVCSENTITSREDIEYYPLDAVTQEQLDRAHCIADALLGRRPKPSYEFKYRGSNHEFVSLPESNSGGAIARLMLVDIEASTVVAIAEVAATMKCNLVPFDGGPVIPPDGAALMFDLARRAVCHVRPGALTLYEMACLEDPRVALTRVDWGRYQPIVRARVMPGRRAIGDDCA